jgi:hypothetical protein
MKTPEEYLELAERCSYAASVARDGHARRQLLTLAESYTTLAESTSFRLRAPTPQHANGTTCQLGWIAKRSPLVIAPC